MYVVVYIDMQSVHIYTINGIHRLNRVYNTYKRAQFVDISTITCKHLTCSKFMMLFRSIMQTRNVTIKILN